MSTPQRRRTLRSAQRAVQRHERRRRPGQQALMTGGWASTVALGSGIAMVLAAAPALATAVTAAAPASGWNTVATADGWTAAAAHPTAKAVHDWAGGAAGSTSGKASSAATGATAAPAAKAFKPGAVNRTATGGQPTGAWVPPTAATGGNSVRAAAATDTSSSAQWTPAKGTTSASPAALAAAGGTSGAAPSSSLAASSTPSSTFGGAGASGAGLGLQQFYGLESFGLSSQLSASVNVGNGNLNLHSRDLAVNAPGLTMRVDQFFNVLDVGQSGTGAAGYGGSLSTGQDIGLLINGSGSGSTATFFGPSGFTAQFTASSATAYTAPAGINADLVKASNGTYTLTYHSNGEKLSFTSGGYLVSDVDRNGVGLSLSYDSSNRLSSITDGAGRVTTLSWNTNGGTLNQITDPSGRTVTYAYTNGVVNTITYTDGAVVTIDTSRTGLLDGVKTPDGNWTYFTYDSGHRVTKIDRFTTAGATSGAAATTRFAYPSSTSTVETDPNGGQTTYTTDSSGRVTKVTDPLGHSRSVTWTPNSDLATAVDALGTGGAAGNTTTYSYDTANNLTAVALPTGAASRASYVTGSACGTTTTGSSQGGTTWQPKCSTDAQGNTASFTYDAAGNVLAVKDTTATGTGNRGTGATPITHTYQAASGGTTSAGTACGAKTGQVCTSSDGNGNKTTYAYDASGNLVTITPPSPLGAVTIGYDSLGRATLVTDGKGVKTTYAYDAYDRVATTTYNATTASATTATSSYDADGNLLSLNDSAAGTTGYAYDALGRQTSTSPANISPTAIHTGYDAAGNLTSVDDYYGQVTYGYNAANQLISMTTPTGSGSSATTETTQFGYNNNGAETSRSYPNGIVTTTTRDNAGRATEIKSTVGSTVIDDQKYTFTTPGGSGTSADKGLVQTRNDVTGNNVPVNSTITYAYDARNELTSAVEKTSSGGASASWGYTYDKAGNRTQVASPVGGTATTYTYNSANEITAKNGSTSGWASDANGNQTSGAWGSATYDVRSALTSLTPTGASAATSLGYTGFGNADRLSIGGETDVNGPVGLQATITSGSGYAFHYTPDGRLISSELPDGTSRYYLSDNIGSVVAVSNASTFTAKYSYEPYGATRSTSGGEAASNPFRYAGAYTGSAQGTVCKMGARYYDPATGRFTQSDPSGQEGNPSAYAANNPVNFADPSGLSTTGTVLKTGAIVAGVAAIAVTGPVGIGIGAVALGLDVAGGVADHDSASEIAGTAILDATPLGVAGVAGKAIKTVAESSAVERTINGAVGSASIAAGTASMASK